MIATRALSAVGAGAVLAATLIVGATGGAGQAMAGSGNGSVNTFVQPTQSAMSIGASAKAAAASTAPVTSLAVPLLKATPLAPECSMPTKCP